MQNAPTTSSNTARCDLCEQVFPNQNAYQQHLTSRKHVKLYNAREDQRRVEQKCGLFITGYPQNLTQDDILFHFAHYGHIVWFHFGLKFLLLDYESPIIALKVLNRRHILAGRQLTIKYREAKPTRFVKPEPGEDISSSMENLKHVKSLPEQVTSLISYLQGPCVQNLKYYQICSDLHNVLRYVYPNCQIYPFGSSITGLWFKTSDIDIYISGIRRDNDEDIRYLFSIKSVLNNSKLFGNTVVIGQAKIPILKCIHLATKTHCDINIRNMLGVSNSRLILYYLSINSKIREMMIILKYWARLHKITGQNHLFTNYSFCMMLIFFLQGEPYKLPSVRYLQQDPNFAYFQEHWNGGFKAITVNCPKIESMPILHLLTDFFSYYANFDYGTNVICPYLGQTVNKSDFVNSENTPDSFYVYKEFIKIKGNRPLKTDASICIQDPFEHTRNVTPVVSLAVVNIFVQFCKYAESLCRQGPEGFLYKLFNQAPANVEVAKLTQQNFVQFGVQMGSQFKYLSIKVADSKNKIGAIKELWFESVKNFTLIVLKDFLHLEVTEVPTTFKKLKTISRTDVHTNSNLTMVTYKCTGTLNVWFGRNTLVKVEEQQSKGVIAKETEITKKLLELFNSLDNKAKIIEFFIVLEKKKEPAQVTFNLTKIDSYKKTFKSFGEFLANKFGIWFAAYEKELNESC